MKSLFWVTLFLVSVCTLFWIATSCSSEDDDGNNDGDDDNDTGSDDDNDDNDTGFSLTSSAFHHRGHIPEEYTCESEDPENGISPPFTWTNPPVGTVTFALTCRDPDSPSGDTKHWGLINIPASEFSLAEGISPGGSLPEGAWETLSYTGEMGYAGPCPPGGDEPHFYRFTLYALDRSITGPGEETELDDVLGDVESASIDSTTLQGYFER